MLLRSERRTSNDETCRFLELINKHMEGTEEGGML
jgi:hypothetical protein